MKVLFLCPSLVGAGVERRVCTLIEALDSFEFDVRLGLLRAEGEFLKEISASRLVLARRIHWLEKLFVPFARFHDFTNGVLGIFQIRQMLKQVQPDIVVSFTLETTIPMFFVSLGKFAYPLPWIISEDSNTAAATVEVCRSMIVAVIVQSVLGKVYRKASHISCVSTSVQNSVQCIYRVSESQLSTQYNPIDLVRVRKGIEAFSEAHSNPNYILAVGRLVPIKRFDLLIRVFAEIRKTRNIKLVILGEGPERENLSRMVIEYGLEEQVIFRGFVCNPWGYMSQAKMLVLTSKLEGFGNVIGESMAAGCPVVATRCGGPEDIIQNNRNGILVEQSCPEIVDAIRLILDDPVFSDRLIRNALVDVERYDPMRISTKFGALLKKMALKRG